MWLVRASKAIRGRGQVIEGVEDHHVMKSLMLY
jgi:hypothetical protein